MERRIGGPEIAPPGDRMSEMTVLEAPVEANAETRTSPCQAAAAEAETGGITWKEWLLATVICLSAMVLLFVPGRDFGLDWPGHLWLAGYHGEYFRQHGAFPEVLNTDWLSGMPYPVFYGFLFYPVAGWLSFLVGADVAMRGLLIAVTLLQCFQVYRLMSAASGSRGLGWVSAAAMTWSTYALTNLYNRSALPEYVAIALLVCSFCCVLRILLAEGQERLMSLKWEACLWYALSAGTHPLTAVFGAMLLGIAGLAMLVVHRDWRRLLGWSVAGVAAAAVVLSPWLYATLKFHESLSIRTQTMRLAKHFAASIDAWWVRLCPWPLDIRVTPGASLPPEATPYLDAQINAVLLLLALWFSWRMWTCRRARSAWRNPATAAWLTCAVVFVVAYLASVWPAFFRLLPDIVESLQFSYRLVAYQNLALLGMTAGALVSLGEAGRPGLGGSMRVCLTVVWVIGVGGLVLKLVHGAAAMHGLSPDSLRWRQDRNQIAVVPKEFYGWRAYAVIGNSPANCGPSEETYFPMGVDKRFGQTGPIQVELDSEKALCVQLQPFPWTELLLDHRPVSEAEACRIDRGYVIQVPAGRHEITWRWQPDRAWVWLGGASSRVLVIWVLAVAGLRIWAWRQRRQAWRGPEST